MQLNEHHVISALGNVIQFPLWPDNELLEVQPPTQDENQDGQEKASSLTQGDPLATQLYLPGFEPK